MSLNDIQGYLFLNLRFGNNLLELAKNFKHIFPTPRSSELNLICWQPLLLEQQLSSLFCTHFYIALAFLEFIDPRAQILYMAIWYCLTCNKIAITKILTLIFYLFCVTCCSNYLIDTNSKNMYIRHWYYKSPILYVWEEQETIALWA